MTMLVIADAKGRITLRGVRKGQKFLVKQERGGWWVAPASEIRKLHLSRNQQKWAGSKRSLDEHLQALADAGLRIETVDNAKQPVPQCRF